MIIIDGSNGNGGDDGARLPPLAVEVEVPAGEVALVGVERLACCALVQAGDSRSIPRGHRYNSPRFCSIDVSSAEVCRTCHTVAIEVFLT